MSDLQPALSETIKILTEFSLIQQRWYNIFNGGWYCKVIVADLFIVWAIELPSLLARVHSKRTIYKKVYQQNFRPQASRMFASKW